MLFLDEPFSALDQVTRRRLIQEIAALLPARRMATVFVTHDLAEVSMLCDRRAILDAGVVLQCEPIAQVISRPLTARVAEIVGVDSRQMG